jgi:hypothetical protein
MALSLKTKQALGLVVISLLMTSFFAELFLRWLKIPQLSYGDNLPLIYRKDDQLGFRFIPNAKGVYKRYFEWETEVELIIFSIYER